MTSITTVAAVVREPGGRFELEEVELDGPAPDEVLVEVVACGLCHADLMARDQEFPVPLPVVAGHEGAGVVQEVGEAVEGYAPGDRVLMSFSSCGHCATCSQGRPYFCGDFFRRNFGATRTDGTTALSDARGPIHSHFFGQSSFARHATVPARNLVRVDPAAPLELYAPLGCGVQTGAGAVINSLRVGPSEGLAVFGAGSVGLSAVMAAQVVGAGPIIAVDVHPSRLELARELGATVTVQVAEGTDLVAAVRAATGGHGVLHAIDTTGRPAVIRDALESLAVTGTLGLLAPGDTGGEATLSLLTIVGGRTVRGIQEGDSVPSVFIPRLIDLHRRGRLPLERLVTTFAFEDINEAAAASSAGEVVKPVLLMS